MPVALSKRIKTQTHHVVEAQVQLVQREVLLGLAGRLARGVLWR